MSRNQIVLPNGIRIVHGWDGALGFYVVASRGAKRLLEYDATQPGYDGLRGLLRALVAAGLFSTDEVEAGLDALLRVDYFKDIQNPQARAIATIFFRLKQVAANTG